MDDNPFVAYGPPDIRNQQKPKRDPAPHPLEVHHEKLTSLVNNIGLNTLNEFRALREETDEVMRSISEQSDYIIRQIDKLTEDAAAGLQTITIVKEALGKLKEQFRMSLPKATNLPNKPNGSTQ